jgi:hypothetical protein
MARDLGISWQTRADWFSTGREFILSHFPNPPTGSPPCLACKENEGRTRLDVTAPYRSSVRTDNQANLGQSPDDNVLRPEQSAETGVGCSVGSSRGASCMWRCHTVDSPTTLDSHTSQSHRRHSDAMMRILATVRQSKSKSKSKSKSRKACLIVAFGGSV